VKRIITRPTSEKVSGLVARNGEYSRRQWLIWEVRFAPAMHFLQQVLDFTWLALKSITQKSTHMNT
jgi:hypothetical protein